MRLLPFLAYLLVMQTVGLFAAGGAAAYSIAIHDRLPDALNGLPATGVTAALPGDATLNEFRAHFFRLAAASQDTTLRKRFLARYGDSSAFTAQAFKEFFGMAATMPALGFDPYQAVAQRAEKRGPYGAITPGENRTLQEWVRIGSIYPDLDQRNRGRWLVKNGKIQRTRGGEKIPFDPIVLNMGQVEPLSGQAHAHYGLNNNPKSAEPSVLKERPADFAVPIGFPEAPVLTFAPERAQAYGDLAQLARAQGQDALAALFAGNAFHYLGDVGNQVHTIQVGIFDFFVDATLQAWKVNALCLWGMRCPTVERNSIGVDIIGNHHTWSEEMYRIAFERAISGKPLHPLMAQVNTIFQRDPSLSARWATFPANGPLLKLLADDIVLAGNQEGPEIYAITREITTSDLRKAGYKYDFEKLSDNIVLAKLTAAPDDKNLTRFFQLERQGTVRAASAMAFWWEREFLREADVKKIVDRLLRQQLDELDAADARRAQWLAKHP